MATLQEQDGAALTVRTVVKNLRSKLGGSLSQPQGQVGLAGTAVAYGDGVLSALDVFAAGQFHSKPFSDYAD